ncbi:aspartyl/asparaginyl beta-hydroxylase domain-containing protein [Orrella sp. 11846]|uniref:aspartyl/asparaginyl beta-hydroxylase domain-containing protein n=1 Tax=Orrella sp. 11846 TaxID=3409913 RepID=UPI003B5A4B79
MKWIILIAWLGAVLFAHYRGQVRLPLRRQLLDHSVILAPINALMILTSKIPTTPFAPVSRFPGLEKLEENWEIIRDEALALADQDAIKAPDTHNDIGFNSFFKEGWTRFYLKWYDAKHPSALEMCPKTVALLNEIPNIKAAMFAQLPAGGKLNRHRDPYAGSLRYHLGLTTPNDDQCYIEVDGIQQPWYDGQAMVFDETYVHSAHNKTETNRIVLFCDVERPLIWRWTEKVNEWFGKIFMSAASSPNEQSDQTGFINRLTHAHWVIDQKRKAFKNANRTLYKATKVALLVLAVFIFLAI